MSPIFMLSMVPALIFFTRFLMEYTGCDYYHPACRAITYITNPFMKLIRIKSIKDCNISAAIWTVVMGEVFGIGMLWYLNGSMPLSVIFPLAILTFVLLIWTILYYFLIIMFVGAILSWIPSESIKPWGYLLFKLSSPITAPFDRIIPPIGMFSLSFFVAFLLLSFVCSNVMPYVTKFVISIIS